MASQSIDIVYIAGAGRSGSTLLGDVLGLLPGTLHVGEMKGIFDYPLLPDGTIRCSCGNCYKTCEFWSPIFESLYGLDWMEYFASLRMEGRFPHSREMPLIALRRRLTGVDLPLQVNINEVVKVLSYILSRFSLSAIIDSSKSASFAWLLSQHPDVQIVVVHLVRDPRAVTFSWIRRAIPIHDPETSRAPVRTRSEKEAIGYWVRANMGAWLLKFYGIPYLRIKYESFVKSPAECVQKIISFAQSYGIPLVHDESIMLALAEKRIRLGERHLLGSNPGLKNQMGVLVMSEDTAWIPGTPHPRKILWTAIFLPWLIGFGYPLWPSRI